MLMGDELVVKLPKPRVDQLVESGTGRRFERGRGQPMKEWLTVPVRHGGEWQRLATEALAFVDPSGRRI